MKKCSNPKCIHKEKMQPLSNFSKHPLSPDNLQYKCKNCESIRHKEWRQKNKIWLKISNILYRNTEKGKESTRRASKNYAKKYPKKIRAKNKKHYKNNSERIKQRSKKNSKKLYWEKRFIFYTAFINLKIKKNVV